jgi:hypothetical protein
MNLIILECELEMIDINNIDLLVFGSILNLYEDYIGDSSHLNELTPGNQIHMMYMELKNLIKKYENTKSK